MEKKNDIANDASPEEKQSDNPEKDKKIYSEAEFEERLEIERGKFMAKLAETEKLASLPENERRDFKRGILEKELDEREKAVTKRELMADAVEKLTKAGFPRELAKCLDYSGKTECEASLVETARIFSSVVTDEVNARLRGRSPRRSSAAQSDAFLTGLGI